MQILLRKKPIFFFFIHSAFLYMLWLTFGKVDPLICTRLNIYLSEATTLILFFALTFWGGVFLNSAVPPDCNSVSEAYISMLIPLLSQYIVRLIDNISIAAIIFIVFTAALTFLVYRIRKKENRRIHLLFYIRRILMLGLITIIIPSYFYNRFVADPVMLQQSNAEVNTDASVVLKDDEIKVLLDCDWDSFSYEERANVLNKVIQHEAKILGITVPDVKVTNEDPTILLAKYSDNVIYFNLFNLAKRDLSECLATAMHELYHHYQKSVIDAVSNIPQDKRSIEYFKKANEWDDADKAYSNDKKNVESYEQNTLEVDANKYAKTIVEKYGLS